MKGIVYEPVSKSLAELELRLQEIASEIEVIAIEVEASVTQPSPGQVAFVLAEKIVDRMRVTQHLSHKAVRDFVDRMRITHTHSKIMLLLDRIENNFLH